jgi:hydrogenase-4 component B
MWSLELVCLALLLAAVSGVPGLGLRRHLAGGERIAAVLMGCAALLGLAGAIGGLCSTVDAVGVFPWPVAEHGLVGLDPLSAFFLVPVFLIGGLGSFYGLGYWSHQQKPVTGIRLRLCWGALVAGMGLLVISRHALVFLLGWEIMALAAFFLIVAEEHQAESRQAGWVYLIATHVSTLTLLALSVVWRRATGSYLMDPNALELLTARQLNYLFVMILIGFGIKAGLMPLHFWLPGAHANAPSHVSAIMSGVVLKMGIYGLVRWLGLLPVPPVSWGIVIFTLGAVSALLGILFAIGQHDLKRLLAYSSVENIGIILLGLGMALIGRATGRIEWVALGLAGGLLHVWNHSLFKPLLFLCAGSVIHETHTRQIDRLGGLAKSMPWTAACCIVGALAICGLPPLNGFVSEWLIYLGMLRGIFASGGGALVAIGVPLLAVIGALAVACFVKVVGMVFLGEPRTEEARHAAEAPAPMRITMTVLAGGCILIGLAPLLVAPALDAASAGWLAGMETEPLRLAERVSLNIVGLLALVLVALGAGMALLARRRAIGARTGPTWDCGYAAPTPRMQYTAASFVRTIIRISGSVLRPHEKPPEVVGLFPEPTRAQSHVDDAVLDRVIVPAAQRIERGFSWFHRFHRGQIQHYLLYILVAMIVLLVWSLLGVKG